MPRFAIPLGLRPVASTTVALCLRTRVGNASINNARTLTVSASRSGGGHGKSEDQFDAPGGWLWGVPPGQKPEKEGWEPFMWGLYLALGATGVMLAFKPDTSLDTWALEEARRRLEKEGILPDPFPEKKE